MFGRTVRARRKLLSLSQEDLAKKAGVDAKTIGSIEAGRSAPRLSTVRHLADALQLEGADRDQFFAAASPEAGTGSPAVSTEALDRSDPETVPAQLPPDVSTFTGRADHLHRLTALLDPDRPDNPDRPDSPGRLDGPERHDDSGRPDDPGQPTAVVITAIAGTAGVGKTALAVHWAHRVADRFPDGQLYVNLRGFEPSGTAMAPAEAVRGFLDALARAAPAHPGRPRRAGRPVPQPAGRPADAGGAGQRPRRRAGPPAAAGRAGLPGGGHQPQPADQPGRRRRRPSGDPRPADRRGGAPPAGPPPGLRPGRRPNRTRSTRSSAAVPGCRWRWPSSPPGPPPTPTSR